jgi:hypothetical protein
MKEQIEKQREEPIRAAERIPMDGGDDGARGFSHSAYCCIPLYTFWLMSKELEVSSLAKVITTSIRANSMARRVECRIRYMPEGYA